MILLAVCIPLLFAACSSDEDSNSAVSLAITSFSPTATSVGEQVTIKGSGFGTYRSDVGGKVMFGDVEATEILSYADNRIVVKVPSDAVSGAIAVSANGQSVKSSTDFTVTEYIDPTQFRITSMSPTEGYPSNEVTIKGNNFGKSAKGMKIYFGDVQATDITSFSSTEIKVTIPDNAVVGMNKVSLDNGTEQIFADSEFNIFQGATITGISPQQVWPGEEVTITGENIFDVPASDVTVYFGDVAAKPFSVSKRKIKLTVPEGAQNGTFRVDFKDKQNIPGVIFQRYALYERDFSTSVTEDDIAPFAIANAAEPNYIKVVDGTLEFFYDCETYAKYAETSGARKYRGCEIHCNGFNTWSEGWYGFSFYLPTDPTKMTYKFPCYNPKDREGIVISQIFMNKDGGSWASLLKVDEDKFTVHHRYVSTSSPDGKTYTVDEVGPVKFDAWNTVIIHFRAGRNNKGLIHAWLNQENPTEESADLKLNGINFAWSDAWLDDNHFLGEVTRENLTANYLGAKFGLYVRDEPDLCIRYGEIRCLEGNPTGAFDMVKPRRKY